MATPSSSGSTSPEFTVNDFKTKLTTFLDQLKENRVESNTITGSLQNEVKEPAPGGIKYFLDAQGAASIGVPPTAAIGRYNASMVIPIAFERGEPLLFYVEATVIDNQWLLSAVLAFLRQSHLPGGVIALTK